ncbi:MAG: pyruvate ferredoxin oxidoreductase [Actinobacteria bacterium RBG_19FT_COMBO_54_7]|nr:MAG: pyruvate ferredoxin oxidoreductase [Actinobacteria bacterium RBG_19FT_COMBO_54_7]
MEREGRIINLMEPGHTGCAGCGQAIAARLVMKAAGPKVIVANATGCLEVYTTTYPRSSWEVPWIHSLFENAASVASGMEACLKAMGKYDGIKIIAQAGDGGTADIGIGCLSGMFERRHDILYVCYDNEGYMNTGYQRSSLTPFAARTTTSPSGTLSWGNVTRKKNMPLIAVAHGVPYVATATPAEPRDLMRKVQKALEIEGSKYLHILVPCVPGWGYESEETLELARLAVETGLFPIFEIENGVVTKIRRPKERKLVEAYLRPQKRFAHLFQQENEQLVAEMQQLADENLAIEEGPARLFGMSSLPEMKNEELDLPPKAETEG